jgi:hypothetical protein
MKSKVLFLLLGIISVAGFSSCSFAEDVVLDFKNKTSKEIELVSFSRHFGDHGIKNGLPIPVNSGQSVRLYSDTVISGVEITFSFNGKMYMVDTEYADDYWEFAIEISESPDSPHGIVSKFIHRSRLFGDDIRNMEITEVTGS